MLQTLFKSFLLAVVSVPIVYGIGTLFELPAEGIQMMSLITGIFIYAGYFAPEFERQIVSHNAELKRKLEEDLKRARGFGGGDEET